MLSNPSLITRIAVGKAVGFAIGLVAFLTLPYFDPEVGWLFRWGILFWYTTVGGVIGLFGVYTTHPVLELPMPWWVRATALGAWMNFVLMFFVYEQMTAMLTSFFGTEGWFTLPFWLVLEGAVVGLVIGYLATRIGGEGPETLQADLNRRTRRMAS